MFSMSLNPIAFTIGSFSVYWYGIILGLSIVLGLFFTIREGIRFGLQADFFFDLLLYGVPSAIVGARLYYVIFKWDYYKFHLLDILKIWQGGIAIYGALIGAILCAFCYTRGKGVNFWRILDICAPGLLIGQMLGRWGNFVNQEAYGAAVEKSFLHTTLKLPDFIVDQMNVHGVYHHPTFLYESLWSLLGFLLLLILRRYQGLRLGELFITYITWYSLGRFFIEGLRMDSLSFQGPNWLKNLLEVLWSPLELVFTPGDLGPLEGNIRISQLLALLLLLAGIFFIVIRRISGKANERYNAHLVNQMR